MTDKEILSNDEVDALLEPAGEQGDALLEKGEGTQPVDFANQEQIVLSQFPVLERIHERLAKKLPEVIYAFVGREVEVEMKPLKIVRYGEFLFAFPLPTAINIVKVNPLRGKGLIILDSQCLFSIVENYFGGDGRYKYKVEEREYTPTELRINSMFLEIFFGELKEAWGPIMKLNFNLLSVEMNPEVVNIASVNDVLLISPFEIKVEEEVGTVYVVMPYSMLEPIREQLDLGARSDDDIDPNWIHSVEEEMLDAELEIHSILTKKTLTLREILELSAGDIIPVEMPDSVTLYIEQVPSFRAKYGVSKDKCALKIIDRIQY